MTRRSLKRILWAAAGIVVAYAFVTTFIMQLRYVDSGSMEPTIFGSEENGETVLLMLDGSTPERFDIVVMHSPDTGLIVKRVWGLPNEEISIRFGDVFVEKKLLPVDDQRPPLITIFDERWHELQQYFVTEDTAWSRDGEEWVIEAESVARGSEGGKVFLHRKIRDSYLDRDHRVIEGTRAVNDLSLRLSLRFEDWVQGSAFEIELNEWGDNFRATVEPIDESKARFTIVRSNAEARGVELASSDLPFVVDAWNTIEFANVDNHLSLTVESEDGPVTRVTADYESNVFHRHDDRRVGKTFAQQVEFGAALTRARVRDIRLSRDYFFTPRGQFAVGPAELLAGDQIFVLGDNSSRSRDSREYGPIQLENLYGQACYVAWPFSSWRSLSPEKQP